MTILSTVRGFNSAGSGCVCPIYPESENEGHESSCEDVDIFWCRIRNEVVADLIRDKVKEIREQA